MELFTLWQWKIIEIKRKVQKGKERCERRIHYSNGSPCLKKYTCAKRDDQWEHHQCNNVLETQNPKERKQMCADGDKPPRMNPWNHEKSKGRKSGRVKNSD